MMKNNNYRFRRGFTLIELLIVIAILAVLATIAFIGIDPLSRFQDTRNAKRSTDVNQIVSAIKLYQVDNQGSFPPSVAELGEGSYYEIGEGTNDFECAEGAVAIEPSAVSLEALVNGGYLPSVPVDPSGTDASINHTYYYLMRDSRGIITVGACNAEKGTNAVIPVISATR